MELGLRGRLAAVAASSGGLGFATAKALADEGVTVAVCSRDRTRINEAAARIGRDAIAIVADVSTTAGATAFMHAASEALGRSPDILIANCGGPTPGGFDDMTLDDYRAAFEMNALTSIAMCQEALPGMRERKWGRVIAITSVVVKQPVPYLMLSNTARLGLHGFLKTTARAVARDGVTVNAMLPGSHMTDRIKQLYDSNPNMIDDIPVGFMGRPEDFGSTAAFLCSDHARYITGSSIVLDGGSSTAVF